MMQTKSNLDLHMKVLRQDMLEKAGEKVRAAFKAVPDDLEALRMWKAWQRNHIEQVCDEQYYHLLDRLEEADALIEDLLQALEKAELPIRLCFEEYHRTLAALRQRRGTHKGEQEHGQTKATDNHT